MKFLNTMLCATAIASSAFAANHDVFFNVEKTGNVYAKLKSGYGFGFDHQNKTKFFLANEQVRIRVFDPPKGESRFGFKLRRPFLVIDGIYLNPEGKRTLSAFQDEADQFGLTDVLKELGYTPILVQFSETVHKSLQKNSEYLTAILNFMNDNALFGFENKQEDGFIVMGISQGGVLGRYGAYMYDSNRKSSDAPIRVYASLDSPHQGAVLPLGLRYTIDFWAGPGGAPAAEKFGDMLEGPGASELLLHKKTTQFDGTMLAFNTYDVDTGNDRFLFNEYRKAASYKGFPSVLLSQGQMKGKNFEYEGPYYELNRKAVKFSTVFGRAESTFGASNRDDGDVEFDRVYQKFGTDARTYIRHATPLDFIQGSTYPFAETMYNSLREGFLEAIPDQFQSQIFSAGSASISWNFTGSWDADSLYQASSTFIPSASAIDLQCNGDLAIRSSCAATANSKDFPFENPGERSTAEAVFVVDETHPRYNEPMSGRHIELPGEGVDPDTTVLRGMQTDIWRLLCEVARYDVDPGTRTFRNPNLVGAFEPGQSCMDQSKMSDLFKNMGMIQQRTFGYGRYDYNAKATESDESVEFSVPAGWHKVAVFDNGVSLPEGSSFEIDIQTLNSKSNWLKAELLLTQNKSGTGQIQLKEVSIPVDGNTHKVRWQLPMAEGSLGKYRWLRLVLNSDGVKVKTSAPKLLIPQVAEKEVLATLDANTLVPNLKYSFKPWTSDVKISSYGDKIASGVEIDFSFLGSGAYLDLRAKYDLGQYRKLLITYWPGTCQETEVYFDSYRRGAVSLANGKTAGKLIRAEIPLNDVIDTRYSSEGVLPASRMILQASHSNERCLIYNVRLE